MSSDDRFDSKRRAVLKAIQAGAASAALGGRSRQARAQADKILIGFWPLAAGQPV